MTKGRSTRKKKRPLLGDEQLKQTVTIVNAGTVLSGRYYLVREIARGGMGVVFEAEDKELEDNVVAIKVLPPELAGNNRAKNRLKKEALAAIKLTHSNILRLHGFEVDGQTVYLIMEYLNGGSLEDAIEDETLTEDDLLLVAKDICPAIDFAHKHGVIHRDIKPANLMFHNVAGERCAKVADLGIAYVVKDSMTRLTNTEATGTLLYMAPEQLQGKRPDPKSDQYSLAVTFYELLSGDPPFFGPAVSHQILNGEVEPIEGISDTINRALIKALSKSPDERFASCSDFLAALEGQAGFVDSSEKPINGEKPVSGLEGKSVPVTKTKDTKSSEAEFEGKDSGAEEVEVTGDSIKNSAGLPVAVIVCLILFFIYWQRGDNSPAETATGVTDGLKVSSVAGSAGQASALSCSSSSSSDSINPSDKSSNNGSAANKVTVDLSSNTSSSDLQPTAVTVSGQDDTGSSKIVSAGSVSVSDSNSMIYDSSGRETGSVVSGNSNRDSGSVVTGSSRVAVSAGVKPVFINSVKMKFVWIPSGSFTMGTSSGSEYEAPPHKVSIRRGFWISSKEVTNKSWKKVMGGSLPSSSFTDDRQPVTFVSFEDGLKFCKALSRLDKTAGAFPDGSLRQYTLPSEAEWEYAARGGVSGNSSLPAWSSDNSRGKPHAVGQLAANRFGVYDMVGNVWEWTSDIWHDNYKGAPSDGSSWNYDGDNSYRVIRGGSFEFPKSRCRPVVRLFDVPYKTRRDTGLRIVLHSMK